MASKSLFGDLELYDLPEIAELTGVSVSTLRRYIREGRLRARRFGNRYRATREQVEAFVRGEEPPSRTPLVPPAAPAAAPAPLSPPEPPRPVDERVDQTTDAPAEPQLPVQNAQPLVPSAEGWAAQRGQGEDNGGPPQLLFMKPEDIDKLVTSLASHTEQIEEDSRRRGEEMTALIEDLREENKRLRRTLEDTREENRRLVHEMSAEVTGKLLDPRRDEQDRIRFTWLRGKLDEVADRLDQMQPLEEQPEPRRPRWQFWGRR